MADLVKLVEQYTTNWSNHNKDGVASFLADDIFFSDVMSGGDPVVGKANFLKEIYDGFVGPVPDCKWTPSLKDAKRAPVVSGNTIAFEWTFEGTNTNDWPDGTEASGKYFKSNGVTIFRFNDAGKIEQYIDYIDYMTISKAMGWVE